MKKFIAVGLTSLGLIAGSLAYAHPGPDKGPEGRLEHLKAELHLTADQESKLRALFQKQHEKMKAIHEETRAGIASILTAEQKTKFEQMKEEHEQRMKDHH